MKSKYTDNLNISKDTKFKDLDYGDFFIWNSPDMRGVYKKLLGGAFVGMSDDKSQLDEDKFHWKVYRVDIEIIVNYPFSNE